MEAVLALNTAKLRHRYGEHYNDTDSAQRREKEEKFEQTEEYKAILANILEGIKHEIE
jgi:hypothetical protein